MSTEGIKQLRLLGVKGGRKNSCKIPLSNEEKTKRHLIELVVFCSILPLFKRTREEHVHDKEKECMHKTVLVINAVLR